jgi:hypothetical protein
MVVSGGTVGDFGDRNPEDLDALVDDARPKVWTKNSQLQEAVATKAVEEAGSKLITQNILLLVDLQGVYLGLHGWLTDQGFPIDGGLVLSRLATLQILDAFDGIKERVIAKSNGKLLDFNDLLTQISKAGPGGQVAIQRGAVYANFKPAFELFYAPVPLKQIEWQLQKAARTAGGEARVQLELLSAGILKRRGVFERDYAAYTDFVAKLKANPEYSRSHEGFFNFHAGDGGLKVFDEKEVDTRIVIRSMEALYGREADALCIVSSDQDFLPVHAKAADFGVRSFQADLAKFADNSRVGRRIKGLGEDYLAGRFGQDWPLKLIIEASTVPDRKIKALYTLSEDEFEGLCRMHNSMNRFHVAPYRTPEGSLSIAVSKP